MSVKAAAKATGSITVPEIGGLTLLAGWMYTPELFRGIMESYGCCGCLLLYCDACFSSSSWRPSTG
jgi:hypothetical protein